MNASVEFDEKTLQPTYRLLIGLAGASSGIEIARRFGIKQAVIDAARENLDISAQEAEAYLQKLQTETKRAEDLRIALEEEREATAMKYAGLEVEAVKKEKARQKEFERELAETVESFERQSRAFIATLKDKALKNKLDKERSARKAEMNRAVISKIQSPTAASAFAAPADTGTKGSVPSPGELAVGSKVVTTFGKVGTIEKVDKDSAEVSVGSIRLREKLADLRVAEPAHLEARPAGREASFSKPIDSPDAAVELNLIGKTTAEAEYELDRFIDEAYMASLPRVRIIHGFGTGALKNYVHHFLKNHDLVEKFAFAPADQGGNGATVAEMKI